MSDSIFTPVATVGFVGWQYTGDVIDDEVVLAFAKLGYIIEHAPVEYKNETGPYCTVTNRKGSAQRFLSGDWIVYHPERAMFLRSDYGEWFTWEPIDKEGKHDHQ